MIPAPQTGIVYLNGAWLPLSAARVHPLDRGFIFGDGVYEVLPVYGRRFLGLESHLQRLDHSLRAVRIPNPHDVAGWRAILTGLCARAPDADQSVYLQVTRGVAPRDHAFPTVQPTVFCMSRPLVAPSEPALREGLGVVLREDFRWLRCDIKSTALQGAVLLRQEALDAGADEALLVRDGCVTEGAASNVFAVLDGAVVTPPRNHLLLAGITRDLVLEHARAAGCTVVERPLLRAELARASELWLCSSTKEVLAITRVDGVAVGEGRPGPVWAAVHARYRAALAALRAQP